MKKIYLFIVLIILPQIISAQTVTYDELNRPINVVYADGTEISYEWDAAGNPIARLILSTILPVQLLEFTAWPETEGSNTSQLKWRTASEQNTESFIVQWSTNGTSWSIIDTIQAVGNTSIEQTYTALHSNPVIGNNYYRLHILDADGTSEYSNVAIVTFTQDEAFSMNLVPNPTKNELNVSFLGYGDFQFVGIFDMSGRQVVEASTNQSQVNWTFDVSALSQGIYSISFKNGDKAVVRRFIKQ